MIRIPAALLAAATLAAAAPAPAPIAGRWISAGGKALVEIAPCGATLCGKILKLLKTVPGQPVTDVRNPDPAKRNRPFVGLQILTGFAPGGEDWVGTIYDPKTGATYKGYLRIEGAQLKVRGCAGPFCKNQFWTRPG
ncbi:MAG: DUF2147 domain-containing protein [Sphingomonas sp.]